MRIIRSVLSQFRLRSGLQESVQQILQLKIAKAAAGSHLVQRRWRSHDKNHSISRYPIPSPASLPQDILHSFAEIEEKIGFVPNVMRVLAHRPDEYRAFFQYYDVLMSQEAGHLTKAEKELIIVATSGRNQCLYCVVAHSAIHRIYSKNLHTADQAAINPDSADITPRERAILQFALKVSSMTEVTDEDFQALADQGLNKEDAWDIGAIASFFAMSNRMALVSRMRPNPEFYLMGRIRKNKSKDEDA